jgi:uncharacterized MAPEG superfamily protein
VSEREPPSPGPYCFVLSQEEAKTTAARAALRATLAGRLSRNHVAPLAAFALFLAFVAILTFTGLLGRRFGEAALLLAAIAFMASRMVAHWRLRGAQKTSLAAAIALHQGGKTLVRIEDSGLMFENAGRSHWLAFADCEEAENAGGIVYLWPRRGEPALIPAQAFANEQAAQEFLEWVRLEIRRPRA